MPLISKPEFSSPDERALTGYVHAVAAELGVPAEDTGAEVSDIAAAHVLLTERSPSHPGRDLLLTWDNRHGWELAAEEDKGRALRIIATYGNDFVPAPADVARFVRDAIAGRDPQATPRARRGDPLTELTDRYREPGPEDRHA